MDTTTILVTLIIGGYAFTAGCYAFVWKIYSLLSNEITNHLRGELDALKFEISQLKEDK